MFTGIIQTVGSVRSITPLGGDKRFCFNVTELAAEGIALGDSMAVNGVCLTAIELPPGQFVADVSNETLGCTTLGALSVGDAINLELAMLPTSRLGGHLVSGHVDGVGTLRRRYADGRSERFEFKAPAAIARYIAAKGSVCIDGASLTVNNVNGDCFDVNLIPHTLENTISGSYQSGSAVNLEVDVVARYVERLLTTGRFEGDSASLILADAGLVTKGV